MLNVFNRLKQGLKKTRRHFGEGIAHLFLGKKEIDEEVLEKLEALLLSADMGVSVTDEILQVVTAKVNRKELKDIHALTDAIKAYLLQLLSVCEKPFYLPTQNKPTVILVVGVNGAGKTTTIGKLAFELKKPGKKVLLAAGDTFRAAAVEQLLEWGKRNEVSVIAQQAGAECASVIFDALQAAKAREMDVLIADTAGRLHTKDNLMQELQKVKRVLNKIDASAPHEVWLVLDAGNGQNALTQAEQFHRAVGLTGIVLTKLDGTAKGGIVFAIAKKLGLPIPFVGVGEGIEDLKPFEAKGFVEALFS